MIIIVHGPEACGKSVLFRHAELELSLPEHAPTIDHLWLIRHCEVYEGVLNRQGTKVYFATTNMQPSDFDLLPSSSNFIYVDFMKEREALADLVESITALKKIYGNLKTAKGYTNPR